MEQIISSCHSVIKYNNNYYCAWNDKHKKYAPIGGKTDAGETELMTLAREINEEVTVKGYKSVERLGVHVHEDPHQTPKRIVNVALYIVETTSVPVGKESFITVVKLNKDLADTFNETNAYSSLMAICKKINLQGGR